MIRSFVRRRRIRTARRDCGAIVSMIIHEHKPLKIYQWGSLINGRHFSERSDIDIALEGITEPAELSEIRGSAEKLIRYPLDIVAIEHMHPAYAQHIRRRGNVAYACDKGPDPELVAEQIDLCFRVLDDMERFLVERGVSSATVVAPDWAARNVVAHILETSYTAIETGLLRVSQGFDNSLGRDRWHADLLDKMLLEKKGVRPRVLSDESHRLLTELMRFRRFKRYYLELDYDWEKLRFLLSVLQRCLPLVRAELTAFREEVIRGLAES